MKLSFGQKRILASYRLASDLVYHHVTCAFDSERRLVPQAADLRFEPRKVKGYFHVMPSMAASDILKSLRDKLEPFQDEPQLGELTTLVASNLATTVRMIALDGVRFGEVVSSAKRYVATRLKRDREVSYQQLADILNDRQLLDLGKSRGWYYSFIRFERDFKACGERMGHAHITVNVPGHAPVKTRKLIEAFYKRQATVSVDLLRSGGSVEYYTLPEERGLEMPVELLKIFYVY